MQTPGLKGSSSDKRSSLLFHAVGDGEKNVLWRRPPVIVTDVPSFESPSNFEDLLHDPKIVFRGQAGIEKAIDAKSIKRLQVERFNKLDRLV